MNQWENDVLFVGEEGETRRLVVVLRVSGKSCVACVFGVILGGFSYSCLD